MLIRRESEYIESVCTHVKWKQAHECIRTELASHIEDQRNAFISEGMDDDKASEAALRDMGDIKLIGSSMNKAYRPHISIGILVSFALIFIVGCLLRGYQDQSGIGQITATVLGIALCFVIWRFLNVKWLMDKAWLLSWLFISFLFLMFVFSYIYQFTMLDVFSLFHRAAMYVNLFQPFIVALMIWRSQDKKLVGMLRVIGMGVLMLVPCAVMPNVFLLACLLAADAVLMVIAIASGWFGEKKWKLSVVLTAVALAAMLLVILISDEYRYERLSGIFGISLGIGSYQADMIRDILGNTPLFGRVDTGLVSEDTLSFLKTAWADPGFANSDHMLVIAASNTGRWIYYAVGGLLAAFSAFTVRTCIKRKNPFMRLTALSVVLTFIVQWVGYLLSNIGIAIAPMPMPFISPGGASMLVNMILMGLLLNTVGTGCFFRGIPQQPSEKTFAAAPYKQPKV